MSLVGPRPEMPKYVEKFRDTVPLYMIKHYVKPGITGLAQIKGLRGDTSLEERIQQDIYYIENWSVWLDIGILLKTPFKAFNKYEQYVEKPEDRQNTLMNKIGAKLGYIETGERTKNKNQKILYAASTASHLQRFHMPYIEALREENERRRLQEEENNRRNDDDDDDGGNDDGNYGGSVGGEFREDPSGLDYYRFPNNYNLCISNDNMNMISNNNINVTGNMDVSNNINNVNDNDMQGEEEIGDDNDNNHEDDNNENDNDDDDNDEEINTNFNKKTYEVLNYSNQRKRNENEDQKYQLTNENKSNMNIYSRDEINNNEEGEEDEDNDNDNDYNDNNNNSNNE
jgi:hypothetical protein